MMTEPGEELSPSQGTIAGGVGGYQQRGKEPRAENGRARPAITWKRMQEFGG